MQLTAPKDIINIDKVLPIDGQPRLVFIKMTDLLAVGRSFLFMYVFSKLVAKTYTSNYQSERNQLLVEVMENKIKMILVSHKDRFVRFVFDWFEKFCNKFNVEIVVVKNERLSPHEELVQDIVSILHVFSCRMYGLRKYKKQIEGDENLAKGIQDGDSTK